jgi:HTH-type transcriptional regulator/antitoxin HigA
MIDNFSAVQDDVEDCEIVANRAAAEFCVPQDKMNSFYLRKNPYFSERDVIGFAAVLAVHPAIVIGQLQRRLNRYDFLRKYQVPIRKYLIKGSGVDGWGSTMVTNSEYRGG